VPRANVPKGRGAKIEGMEIVAVSRIDEALDALRER
jgi:hypothetical protein